MRRYFLTAEIFDTRAAMEAGLVQFQGSESDCQSFVTRLKETLLANGPKAVRATKALIRSVESTADWHSRRTFTTQAIAERRVSAEGQEGLKSYFEKRSPSWKAPGAAK